MGRHADPNSRHFQRSLVLAMMRAVFAVGLVLGLVLALTGSGRWQRPREGVALEQADRVAQELELTPSPAEPPPGTAPPVRLERRAVQSGTASEDSTTSPAASPTDHLPAPGLGVQVLDGVGDRVRMRAAVEVLEQLGYEIVATNPAAIEYAETTVLYTPGYEQEAEALRRRDGRFSHVRVNENLSKQVPLHIVVGRDWEL